MKTLRPPRARSGSHERGAVIATGEAGKPLVKSTAYAEFTLKVVSIAAFLVAAWWAGYQYNVGGSTGWMVNLDMTTEVLPYKDDLRMLVVHVKSKNPRAATVEFDRKAKDSFTLTVRKIPEEMKAGAALDIEKGSLIKEVDLMPRGGEYLFLPNAEFDDMATVILPVNTMVSIAALLQDHEDNFVGIERVAEVKP